MTQTRVGTVCRLAVASLWLMWGCSPGATPPTTRLPAVAGPQSSGVTLESGARLDNLAQPKAEIVAYHDSGEWERQISAITAMAIERLDAEIGTSDRPALVLDIDDTALSTYAIQKQLGFGWVPDLWVDWVDTATAPPHPGTLALYRHALERGVAVFFITGRREPLRSATERQLHAAGYSRWVGLDLKPAGYSERSTTPYKVARRREIEAKGFDILVNIGDQWSDLEGGFARATFKLPNPMYYTP